MTTAEYLEFKAALARIEGMLILLTHKKEEHQ